MKKIGFMIVALFLGHGVYAQIQQESFDSSEIPAGWIYEINSNATNWQFGYTGVMPHSGPTIESEFATGAALFNDNNRGLRSNDKTTLTTPAVDVSELKEVQIEVTYNLQVEDDKGEFSIEVYNGKKWKEVYFQDTSSPRNTGMNEVVVLEVSDFLNDEFQVRFNYDDEGQNITQGIGIDHYELIDASNEILFNENAVGAINVLNLPDNVLVLDSNEQFDRENMLQELTDHLTSSELSTDSIMYNLTRFPTGSEMFRVKEETNVGSYKALKK